MSLDYQNREEWLACRATPRNLRREKLIHVSKPLMTIKNADGNFETIVSPASGSTYNVGNNARKRAKKLELKK